MAGIHSSLEWNSTLRLGARYDSEGVGRSHWVLFRMELSPVPGYHLSGFYAGQDVRGGSGLFGIESLIGLALRGRLYGPADLFFHFTRRLRRRGDDARFANEIGGGAGLSITY